MSRSPGNTSVDCGVVVETMIALVTPATIALIVAAAAVLIAALVVVVRIFTDKQQE